MNYHNQLILTGKINDIGEALTANIPKSYRSGMEMMGGIKPLPWLRWDGNLTLSRNRIKDFTEYVDVYDANWNWTNQQANHLANTPIAFSPSVTGNSLITFSAGKFEAGFQTQYVGKQYIDNTGSDARSLESYLVNNLRLSYTLPIKGIRNIGLTILLNNVFNKQYISNAWTYSSYYNESALAPNVRYDDFGYYPQAGFNCLAGITVKF